MLLVTKLLFFKIKTFPIENFPKLLIAVSYRCTEIDLICSLLKEDKEYKFPRFKTKIIINESRRIHRLASLNDIYYRYKQDKYGLSDWQYTNYSKLDTFKDDFLSKRSLLDLQYIKFLIIEKNNEKQFN